MVCSDGKHGNRDQSRQPESHFVPPRGIRIIGELGTWLDRQNTRADVQILTRNVQPVTKIRVANSRRWPAWLLLRACWPFLLQPPATFAQLSLTSLAPRCGPHTLLSGTISLAIRQAPRARFAC